MSTVTIDPDSRTGKAIATVREFFETVEPEKLERLDGVLALTEADHARWQKLRSQVWIEDQITYEDSRSMRNALGETFNTENGGWADGVDTATKYTLTLAFTALLKQKLGG